MPGQKETPRMPFGLADLPCPCDGLRGRQVQGGRQQEEGFSQNFA